MTSIELREVTLRGRGPVPRLSGIDLTVPAGTVLAVVGPVGAGTTTLLRMVVGLDDHDTGELLLDGTSANAQGPRERDLAMVFDDHELYPHLDVRDNLAFSARLRKGVSGADLAERVASVAGLFGLDLDARVRDLTAAEHQQVAIGRALVREARGYLLDQPFAAQSERERPAIRSMTMQWLRERDLTTVIATDDVAEALAVADQVAVMRGGRVHQVGTPRELYETPSDLFVAGFVGAPPMNLMPGVPSGRQLVMPLATMLLDDELLERIGERELVVAGIRPEHCHDAAALQGPVDDRFEFTTRVDEVEWRGNLQHAFLGYDLDPEIETRLREVETDLGLTLFQSFLVAQVPAERPLRPGMSMRVVVPRRAVHLFDVETGENLTLADG